MVSIFTSLFQKFYPAAVTLPDRSSEHNELAALIASGDCPAVLRLIEMGREHLKEFNAVDNSGFSLRKQFLSADLINKKYFYEIRNFHASFERPLPALMQTQILKDDFIYEQLTLTPLQFLLKTAQYEGSLSETILPELKMILELGAKVNAPIDNDGNTAIHEYLVNNPYFSVLNTLIHAGGNVFQKNNNDITPYDKADGHVRRYLDRFFSENNTQERTAIKLQRQWRRHKAKNIQLAPPSPLVLCNLYLMQPPREPLQDNPPDPVAMRLWINMHQEEDRDKAKKVIDSIHHVSFRHFLFGLKLSIKKFNRHLMSLPPEKRKYILLMNECPDKSDRWTANLARRFLYTPPDDIILTDQLLKYDPKPDVHCIVMFDDASYSGNAFFHFFIDYFRRTLSKNYKLMGLEFHLIVPFITERALHRIKEYDVTVHYQEQLAAFNVPGTQFIGHTATYFSHKIACDISTIECIDNGKLITGSIGKRFVDPVVPPYKCLF